MKDQPRQDHATTLDARIRASDLPLGDGDPLALAFIIGVDGPSYRPLGAGMALMADGTVLGSLSSGCIDADITRHAAEVAQCGVARDLRYGSGSPFLDLDLPCGGGLDIRVIPRPTPPVLDHLRGALAARQPLHLWLAETLDLTPQGTPRLSLQVDPDPRFVVFGKGPEAIAFARMTCGAGYQTVLASPDPETLQQVAAFPIERLQLSRSSHPGIAIDAFTAAVLFFHDHDYEPQILAHLLAGPAFYVGAQGSRRTAARRVENLTALGLSQAQLTRLRGPIGLIPSTRDPRTLAASVLAEILAEACQA